MRPPEPDDADRAVHALVLDELAPYGRDAAVVEQRWVDDAGMWFTEVTPRAAGAAPLSVAAQDEDTLNVTVGNVWLEIFGNVAKNLPYLREIVAAVLAGELVEAGRRDNAFGRIRTRSGTVHAGAVHLPLPWGFRRVRRYRPYGGPPSTGDTPWMS